ncbi:MAG: phosphoribosyl-AMP cyclohydrolase [Slackia sp.]
MNEESLRLTLQTSTTWFWSRSRQELWNKGATSGTSACGCPLRRLRFRHASGRSGC